MSGGGFRVSIPNSMKNTIENIKEMTGNHSDEEIYTMLKECSMDLNDTVQKLLLQDTFHLVQRKRGKRKENLNNKESAESRWRPGMQGRGNRGGRVYYSRRDNSHEFGGVRNSALGKENGINQSKDKGVSLSPLPISQEKRSKETSKQASITYGSTRIKNAAHSSGGAGLQPEPSFSGDVNKLGTASSLLPPLAANKNVAIAFGTGDTHGQAIPSCSNLPSSMNSASSSVACFSSLDPVLVPTHDSRLSGTVGAIGREVGSQRTPDAILPAESKLAAEIVASESGSTFLQGKMPSKSQGIGKNHVTESSQRLPSSAHGGSSVSRPLSNYNSRSQQVIGPQKVGPNKEWKPKPTNPNLPQGSGTTSASEVPTISAEVGARSQPVLTVKVSEDGTLKVQRKLGGLHIQDRKHVIIPNHIHVPESERRGLSFGSIDTSFGVDMSYITMSGPESEKSSTSLSESSHGIEETVEEESSSNQNAYAIVEKGNYLDNPQSPTHVPENLPSGEGDVSSSAIPEYNEIKQESALPHGGHQYSVVHTTPNYSFGFVPPILGNQLAPFENTESQARDISRVPSYVVQQPFDPTSYYAQFYRSGADTDGRLSPFLSPGVSTKYNGNITVLSPQSSESPQEGGNPLVLSTATPTPLVSQAAGVLQSSIAMTQQVVPVFRPPTGMHISHYPPNYIPYGYFSPFYVPPPAIHQFLNNGAFPQQPQAAYPAPPQAGAAAGVKYSISQYKPGTNNAGNIGMPSGYGSYTSPASYNTSSTAIAGNSNTNEDLAAAASQFKESNNVYITGQQSEGGSSVWIAAAPGGRELQPTSFYNLGPAGIYHPVQTATTVHPFMQQPHTVAGGVDMAAAAAAAASVYQQQQMNWPTSY